jgi:GYF domain 2
MGVKGRGFCKMSDFASPFTKRPEGGSSPHMSLPPPHPLDEMWYVQGEVAALGPHRGDAVKQMIEQGSISRGTQVAKVGWKEWVALGDVPAFKRFFVDGAAAGKGARKAPLPGFGSGSPHISSTTSFSRLCACQRS